MDANTYQKEAARTLIDGPPLPLTSWEHMVVWNAVGLAGEVGEVLGLNLYTQPQAVYLTRAACGVAELCKKGIFHEAGLDLPAVRTLLEEVLIYTAGLWAERGQIRTLPTAHNTSPLRKELGDVCWYTAALCSKFGWDLHGLTNVSTEEILADVWQANIDKLRVRFPGGWSTAAAAARVDVEVTQA